MPQQLTCERVHVESNIVNLPIKFYHSHGRMCFLGEMLFLALLRIKKIREIFISEPKILKLD